MADFKETLTVVKNSNCFMSFSCCKVKEDLAVDYDDDTLPSPPREIDWEEDITLDKAESIIAEFCETADKANTAIDTLLNCGRVMITEEY